MEHMIPGKPHKIEHILSAVPREHNHADKLECLSPVWLLN